MKHPIKTSAEKAEVFSDIEAKQFITLWRTMQNHLGQCDSCCEYIYHSNGDFCGTGKVIVQKFFAGKLLF